MVIFWVSDKFSKWSSATRHIILCQKKKQTLRLVTDSVYNFVFVLWQVTLDSFTIGRFASYTNAGCPDGDLHITESDRPAVSGGWCGTSWAPAHYYSETNSITLLVRLYTLSSLDNTGYNFDFRLGYKMLNRNRAVVRYGEQQLFASKCTSNSRCPSAVHEFFGTRRPFH